MRRCSLYKNGLPLQLAVEVTEAEDRTPTCELCKLNDGSVRSPCMSGEGEAGGLLLVGESPGRNEDSVGRPFIGRSGQVLRRELARLWEGPVAFDNAIRCAPGAKDIRPKMIDKCRRYLAGTFKEATPSRIVCLGAKAAYSVTGRSVAPFSTRRGYTYLSNGVPVFFVLHPAAALRNRFVMQWFLADFEWALTATPPEPAWHGQVLAVTTEQEATEAVAALRSASWSAFDVETAGEMWRDTFEVISLAATPLGSADSYVWEPEALSDIDVREPLLQWLSDPTAHKIGQNVKFDQLACLAGLGVRVRGVVGDIRLWRKLLEPEASAYLDDMAELVGMGGMKSEAMGSMSKVVSSIKRNLKKENGQPLHPRLAPQDEAAIRLGMPVERFAYKLLDRDELSRYNARDSVSTAALGELLGAELRSEPALSAVWDGTVAEASQALVRVEEWGIAVDEVALRDFTDHLETRITKAKQVLDRYPDVNWNSAPQIRKLLYESLRLPVLKRTAKTAQPSTDAATLELLRKHHSLPGSLLDYRFLKKMHGTYAVGMWDHIRSDGRIHPNIKLDGARSGRTSCTDPNLQNIPRAKDSPEGKMARDIFIAPPGHTLIDIDYSQLELRVAAMLSGDPLMRDIFVEGVDYHQRTAEMISVQAWGIQPEEVESKHRTQAKTINFALLYGMSDKTLAAQLGITIAQAGRIREAILGKFAKLDKWCQAQLRETRKTGFTWTWWNGQRYRRRPLWRVADSDSESRSRAEHGSWNTPVQGTASDFCVKSLAECVKWIVGDGLEGDVKLVLAVHDSLMFDVRDDMVAETLLTVRDIMTGWPSLGVPLVVDAKAGRSWGSLQDVDWEELAA